MAFQFLTHFQLKLLLQRTAKPCLIALDLGSNSTGVSISCPKLKDAYFLQIVRSHDSTKDHSFVNNINTICKSQKVTALIIGKTSYPEAEQRKNKIIDRFKQKLKVPYSEIDEEGSTIKASEYLVKLQAMVGVSAGLHHDKDLRDGIASVIILQRYLNYYNK